MMLRDPFPMLPSRALLALAASVLAACGPGAAPESGPAAVASARAMVRPFVARNALSMSTSGMRDGQGAPVTPGTTSVVLGHLGPDGTLRVGCVDTEDGAEALVRATAEER
ncbi:MAG TPA: hypothetical protein VFI53_02810 [Myxococcaceae bacterium]|nr:hypothetical protein [Myxococcaceae bacterium]